MARRRRFFADIALLLLSTMVVGAPRAGNASGVLPSAEQASIKQAAERVAESVVQIRTIGGLDTIDGTLRVDGPTSGLVISPDGYILSSAFNFVEEPASILVTFASGRQAAARLIAKDHSRMLVLLKVDDATELVVPEVAPLDDVRVGQWAIVVGRTFRADQTNVAVGIVSALRRMHGRVLQTDAAVSTANYGGPLVDIRGRVVGIVVPIAPQSSSEVAGVEWYDSGIGFAVPLAEMAAPIERMKRGEDQHSGILGIGMRGKNPHDSPALLAAVRPDSPAGLAGFRKGDQIVEIDGRPIKSQTDLRFALVPRYGGEKVQVVATRGDERISRTVELAGELPAFRHAFLGVLPQRPLAREASSESPSPPADDKAADADAIDRREPAAGPGIVVRHVYPGSPAELAGIRLGDRLTHIGDTEVADIASAIDAMNSIAPGTKVLVRYSHADDEAEPREVELTAARLPTNIPTEIPPAETAVETPDKLADAESNAAPVSDKAGETVELKLPEFKQGCKVYVPKRHARSSSLALVLWIHAPGKADAEQTIRDWQTICDRDGVLLVVPTAADPSRWEQTELEYLRRLLERALMQYSIDSRRVVLLGEGGGGAMAYQLGLASRDIVRAVATIDSPLPRQVRVPENEPSQRFAILAGVPTTGSAHLAQLNRGLGKLADAGYPVSTVSLGSADGRLSDDAREEFARWIDSLDHF